MVYSATPGLRLDGLFARYDQQLADSLGVKLASDDDYEIAFILSQEWWDDGRWEQSEKCS